MSDKRPPDGPEEPTESTEVPRAAEEATEAESASVELAEALEPPPEAGPAEAYHQRARLAEDRLAEVLAAYRTLKRETEGYRDRIAKNVERRFDQRRERLLVKFIDILDNLDRALDAAETTYAGEPLIEGLILVRTQLLQTLKDEGLERIPVIGLPYDPHVSEAVETRLVEDPEHHHLVVKELMRGYRLNGRLARPSRVVVGEHPGAGLEPPAPAPAAPKVQAEAPPAGGDEGPSLEDIISRTEAQEALFPGAFGGPEEKDDKEDG